MQVDTWKEHELPCSEVFIVCSEIESDGCRIFEIEGVFRKLSTALQCIDDVAKNGGFFEEASNPVIDEHYRLSSKDYEDSNWHEIRLSKKSVL